MNRLLLIRLAAAAVLTGMAGCAEIKKPVAQAKAMPTGLRFDQTGRVTLFAGEPCASPIMFDFHGAQSTVWLAARRNETDVLTEAVKKNRRVHVSGKWRRGVPPHCSYVEVTSAEVIR